MIFWHLHRMWCRWQLPGMCSCLHGFLRGQFDWSRERWHIRYISTPALVSNIKIIFLSVDKLFLMLMQWVILVQCPQNRNSGGFWTALLLFPYKYRWALEVVFGHFSNGFNVGNFCFLQQARYMRYLIDIIDIIYLQNLKLPPTDWQHLKILMVYLVYLQAMGEIK